ncbi:MAG: DNA alkylation repair protein [Spirochaetales bacterium]|jgi:3-methyladenine DNA glycosylase AlkD|nr:DNA alkylation repair protein [Spirochaetales bacterium]
MTFDEIMAFLKAHENPSGKKILMRHGARDPFFGVRIGDMKPIVKKIKKNHELAMQLYASGNSDAMYFAGLIADETVMSKGDLQKWVNEAYWYMLSEYAVAGVAAETPFWQELAKEWMKSEKEMITSAGWSTYSGAIAIRPDDELDMKEIAGLLYEISSAIHSAPNRVRYDMNNFVISVGCYVAELSEKAAQTAEKIGKVSVDMGGTACKVPYGPDYIAKVIGMGRLGKKRKAARC